MDIKNLKLLNVPNLPKKEYHVVLHCTLQANHLFDSIYQDFPLSSCQNEEQLFNLLLEVLMVKNLSIIFQKSDDLNYLLQDDIHFKWLKNIIATSSYYTPYIINFSVYYYDDFSFKYLVDIDFEKEELGIKQFLDNIIMKKGVNFFIINSRDYILAYLEKQSLADSLTNIEIFNRNIKI